MPKIDAVFTKRQKQALYFMSAGMLLIATSVCIGTCAAYWRDQAVMNWAVAVLALGAICGVYGSVRAKTDGSDARR